MSKFRTRYTARLTGRTVLYCDDEAHLVGGVTRLLNRYQVEVVGVTSHDEARLALECLHPDLVVAGINNDGTEKGMTLLRDVARYRPTSTRALVSGVLRHYYDDALTVAHGVMHKPFDPIALLEMVAQLCEARSDVPLPVDALPALRARTLK